ncbi:MAG TPA: endonuclease III [Verrucomicrobiae bacterium]|nr:endonuclease III [Verrucomicrobiae bacterium]
MANVTQVLRTLGQRYTAKGMTDLGNPADTLLATVLSAQTTDVQVLKAFPGFRRAFPSWKALASADVREIEKTINTVGLYRSKAKAVKGLARMILDAYGGRVPSTMEDLVRLPGVGRKTASVVLSFCFGKPAIAVDTHVFRIARRLGWSQGKDPQRVERDLMKLVPEKQWSEINRTMVPFGREICRARTPECWRCPVAKWCAYPNKTPRP